jgi:hypothetical protein
MALPLGSKENMVACSPGAPLKRTWGSIMANQLMPEEVEVDPGL